METSFDTNSFLPNAFDYNFDTSVGAHGQQSGTAQSTSSASPPAQHLSLVSNDSMDSGIALDLDTEGLGGQDRRSNSVDKELLTPAQSRRKAQNRAAYVGIAFSPP